MKMISYLPFGLLACAMVGACLQATATDNVCDTQPVSFPIPSLPSPPTNIGCESLPTVSLPPLTTTTSIDLSKDLGKVDDSGIVSKLTLAITKLVIDNSQGDLDWVDSVDVQMATSNLPQVDLATYTMPRPPGAGVAKQLNETVEAPAATVLQYLESGSVILTITLTADTVSACTAQMLATMGGTLNSNVEMCVSASVGFNKNL